MVTLIDDREIEGFEWDEGNIKKNEIKHKIYYKEYEQVFLNDPIIFEDIKHSKSEKRYQCLGKTDLGRFIFISFTIRNLKVRIISARQMSRKERKNYEKTKTKPKV